MKTFRKGAELEYLSDIPEILLCYRHLSSMILSSRIVALGNDPLFVSGRTLDDYLSTMPNTSGVSMTAGVSSQSSAGFFFRGNPVSVLAVDLDGTEVC